MMTNEERADLTRFLQMLTQAQAGVKDREAEALIAEACSRQPDAEYLLVQRVLQLEHALKEATQPKTSFTGDANAWGRAPVAQQPSTQAPAQVPMQQSPSPVAVPQQSSWGSGLMGTLAMTAGGVVAGSLLAQGIGSLFGHHNSTPDHSAIPPGGGSLVETDYGNTTANDSGGYVADDFDDGGDSGDVG
jgi:hypothetical protein